MNPNEVRLIDFDLLTLSELNILASEKIKRLGDHLDRSCSEERFFEIQREIDRMRTFRTQVLYAFSLVKSNESVTHN